MFQKLQELPLLIKRLVWHMMDPDTNTLYFHEVRIFAVKNILPLLKFQSCLQCSIGRLTLYSLVFSYYLCPLSLRCHLLYILMTKTRLHRSIIEGRETKFLQVLQMLMSTLYTAAEFSFIPTGKLPLTNPITSFPRIIWNSDNLSCLRLCDFKRCLMLPVLYRRVQNSDGVRLHCYCNDLDSARSGVISEETSCSACQAYCSYRT